MQRRGHNMKKLLWGLLICTAIYHQNQASESTSFENIAMQHIRTFGGIDSKSAILLNPQSIAVDSNQNVYILDNEEPFVKVFSPDGQLTFTFGKKGQGPEEYLLPEHIFIDAQNRFNIFDVKNARVSVLSLHGKFLKQMTLGGHGYAFWMPIITQLKNGNFVGGITTFMWWGKEPFKQPVFYTLDSTLTERNAFGEPKIYENPIMGKTANAINFCIDKKGNIWAAYLFQNRIEKYAENGELLKKFSRPLNFEPTASPQDKEFVPHGPYTSGASLGNLNVVSCGIGCDYKNRIWVMTFTRQPKLENEGWMQVSEGEDNYTKLEVFDQEGKSLAEFPLEASFELTSRNLYIFDKRLFLLDKLNAAVIEYKIIE